MGNVFQIYQTIFQPIDLAGQWRTELSIILMESSLEYYDYRSGQILQQNLFRIYCNLCVVLS